MSCSLSKAPTRSRWKASTPRCTRRRAAAAAAARPGRRSDRARSAVRQRLDGRPVGDAPARATGPRDGRVVRRVERDTRAIDPPSPAEVAERSATRALPSRRSTTGAGAAAAAPRRRWCRSPAPVASATGRWRAGSRRCGLAPQRGLDLVEQAGVLQRHAHCRRHGDQQAHRAPSKASSRSRLTRRIAPRSRSPTIIGTNTLDRLGSVPGVGRSPWSAVSWALRQHQAWPVRMAARTFVAGHEPDRHRDAPAALDGVEQGGCGSPPLSSQLIAMSLLENRARSRSPTTSTMAWKSSRAATPRWMSLITASSPARCSSGLRRLRAWQCAPRPVPPGRSRSAGCQRHAGLAGEQRKQVAVGAAKRPNARSRGRHRRSRGEFALGQQRGDDARALVDRRRAVGGRGAGASRRWCAPRRARGRSPAAAPPRPRRRGSSAPRPPPGGRVEDEEHAFGAGELGDPRRSLSRSAARVAQRVQAHAGVDEALEGLDRAARQAEVGQALRLRQAVARGPASQGPHDAAVDLVLVVQVAAAQAPVAHVAHRGEQRACASRSARRHSSSRPQAASPAVPPPDVLALAHAGAGEAARSRCNHVPAPRRAAPLRASPSHQQRLGLQDEGVELEARVVRAPRGSHARGGAPPPQVALGERDRAGPQLAVVARQRLVQRVDQRAVGRPLRARPARSPSPRVSAPSWRPLECQLSPTRRRPLGLGRAALAQAQRQAPQAEFGEASARLPSTSMRPQA